MKILFLAHSYPNKDNPAEATFNRSVASAVSLFNEVAVICGRKNKEQKELYKFSISREDKILILRFTYRKTLFQQHYFSAQLKSMLTAFKKLENEGFIPQVIQAIGFQMTAAAALLKKKNGIPFVVSEGQEEFILRSLSRKNLEKASFMRAAAAIMPISKASQEGIKSYGIKGRFEIVPGTINTNLFFPSPNKNPGGKLKKIITVARLGFHKGIADILEALRLLSKKRDDFICKIIGGGEKEKEKYESTAKKYQLTSRVFFLGRKSAEEIAEIMRDSDFFLLPTHFEAFGNVFMEAAASGLPIVGTNVDGVAEYFGNPGFGIFIPPQNIGLLAESVNYMLDHYSEYPTEQNARWAKEKFGYETVGKQLTEIYRSVVK
ncbi:MAG: glycosyltransferase [Candidatus Ratteibacteria bacterium]|jgi:glycosyltransferase involved in cell wall biosynthesis